MSKIIDAMLFEFKNNIRNGIYGYTQKTMAYNSNRIEGSKLSLDNIASLFDTQSFVSEDVYRPKDVEETNGHFLMFNQMLKTLNEPLTEDLIKSFHKYLKEGVFEDKANGYMIGDYKTRENIIGIYHTVSPDNVRNAMNTIIESYKHMTICLEEIIAFHVAYEMIHPFQDGNGRTGRLIMFRECLLNDIAPFIIRDENKSIYINALNEARKTGNINLFISYVKVEQDYYNSMTSGMI